MSSTLNATAQTRASDAPLKVTFDAQAFLLRKGGADGGLPNVNDDAFAQVFAAAQDSQQRADPVADTIAPQDAQAPATPKPAHTRKADDKTSEDASTPAEDAAPAIQKPRHASHAHKKQPAVASDDATLKNAATADSGKDAASTSAPPVQTAAADTTAKQPDAVPGAGFSPILSAQEAASKTASGDDKEPAATPELAALNDLLSFCASPDAATAAAGQAGNNAPVKSGKKLEDKTGIAIADATATDVAATASATATVIPGMVSVSADIKASVPLTPKANAAVSDFTAASGAPAMAALAADFSAKPAATGGMKKLSTEEKPSVTSVKQAPDGMAASISTPAQPVAQDDAATAFGDMLSHHTASRKTEDGSAAAPQSASATPTAPAVTDAPVSPTPPAAGSRVNALLGFPAPAPTGSGSGSPSSANAASGNGVEATAALGATGGSAGLDFAKNLQFVKAGGATGTAAADATQQVTLGVSKALKSGASSFEVQLTPENLGKVEIKLNIDKDGLVRAVVTSDNPATHDLLQKDSSALEKVFQQAGLQTDSGSLSFNLREQGADQQAAYQTPQPKAWQRWADTAANDTATQASPQQFYTAAHGRVDLRV